MAKIRLVASQYAVSSTSYLSVSNASNMYNNTDNTTYATITNTNASTSSRYLYLRGFNFNSIPANATINSFTVKIKGKETGLSTSTSYAPRLANGTSALSGTTASSTFGTSEKTITIPTGSLTWDQIVNTYGSNFTIMVYVRRAQKNTTGYFYCYGAEIEVDYTIPVYYDVTITNSSSATVTASETHPLEGTDVEIRSDTLAGITVKDNGVDVTSQFTQRQGQAESYDVVNVGSYGFDLNSGTGYYVSNNKAVSKSAAVCRIDFYVPVAATILFTFINYAEQAYDFGVFGNIDTELSNNYYSAGSSGATITDSSYKLACNSSTYNKSTAQTLSYAMSAGNHSIWVKYSKDDASDANNDTLQFKVQITLDEPYTPTTYYGYDITSIAADHAIVVTASGAVPPTITVGTPSRTIISDETGYDQCVCTFQSNMALQAWEARATKEGTTPARGVGLLVESGGALAANTNATIYVENEELTNGDGVYTITVYGQSTGGVWSE